MPNHAPAGADDLMRMAFPLHEAGDVAAAEALYRRILQIDPAYADAHYLLGTIALSRREPAVAVEHLRRAIGAHPGEAAFHSALGRACARLSRWREAAAAYERAIELAPTPELFNELGCALQEAQDTSGAAACFERALARAPDFLPALNNLGRLKRDSGRVDEAVALLERACRLAPDNADLFSNYLFTLNLSARYPRQAVFEAHRQFGQRFGGRERVAARPRDLDPERPLRIGYFSPDLRAHPVACFIEPVLTAHDRAHYPVTCYYLFPTADAVSERLAAISDGWVHCAEWPDEAVARRIADDRIDILVDLAGHTGWNRLPVLAAKPAPIAATWLGYLNTTGLPDVDYRITDAFSDPPGESEQFHVERVLRLPQGHWCYLRPEHAVAVTPLPAVASGRLCFGSFNKASKLTRETLELWARVLQAVDGAELLFAAVGDEQRDAVVQVFRDAGISPGRLRFATPAGFRGLLELHAEVDVALDPQPYSGTTTTFNSLWMGVPTLTLPGRTAVSRSAGAVLHALGLTDWIARSAPEFIARAAQAACERSALAALRAGLRERLERSALMDANRFSRTLEQTYRQIWRDYCKLRSR